MSKQTDWIKSIAPYAKQASSQTGMSAELMLAQAAQETGWGQKVLSGTNNIFNIKADASWTGETKTFQVPEYINGKVVIVEATFRSYASVEDAFVDRVNFLKSNPRYAKSGLFDEGTLGNPDAEARALQKAGYATDPEYATNLMKVANGPTMQSALNSSSVTAPNPSPAGDSVDADLPDGTRVVSTSTTENGQTTVTAELLDNDGHVLLSAGAGQTMERDPETGIVQVRTNGSDLVQQYDPATGEVSNALRTGSDAAHVYENLLDAFSNPQVPTDKGVQVADASGASPDTTAHASTNTLNNYLDGQGNNLSTAQQTALATQIDQLGLGGEDDLSFYSLPNGGALIANADGDIVGEIVHSNSGDLNLRATGIDADGNTVDVNNHIGEGGDVQTQAQYTDTQTQQVLGDINQGIGLFNALSNIQNWDQLSDVGKLSAVVGLYNAVDGLGAAFGGSGDNLPGDLGAAAGWLSLAQGLQSGDGFVIASGLNSVSDQALDGAFNSAFGSTGVPYVSIALALHNLEDNPAQSIGTLVGMYFGGPLGGAIGGFIGGSLGGALGLGGDPPPPPVGLVHFGWDANGAIIPLVDVNQSGGASAAISVANQLLDGLNQLVTQRNNAIDEALSAQGVDPALFASFHVSVNASTLPSVQWDQQRGALIGYPDSFAWSSAASFFSFVEHHFCIQPEWAVEIKKFQAIPQDTDLAIDDAANVESKLSVELGGTAQITLDGTGNPTVQKLSDGLGGQIAKMYAQEILSQAQIQVELLNAKIDHKLNLDGVPEAQWDRYHVALNPATLPEIKFDGERAYFLSYSPEGVEQLQTINLNGFAEQLQDKLAQVGCIQPSWEYETSREHWINAQSVIHEQQLQGTDTTFLEANALLQLRTSAVYGDASESADFKSQTYGALLAHAQGEIASTIELLRDVDGDGYLEKTQSFAAKDFSGKSQGLLILDFNGNSLIETRDILNLGGNIGQDGNPTLQAALAIQNADLQRNNVEWLDADGDGQLTTQDPAFAAIKLWIDVNQSGQMEAGEAQSLDALQIKSINFRTGEITYVDGHSDALTATTLKADTEGVKFSQINEVNPDGTLHTLDAGTVLEHEGYQGKVQITDEGGTRWASVREQTYEQQAKRTGDWEGTAEQDAHRHGGGNVEGAPTETTATGATDFGPVKSQVNQTTQSTVTEGSARVVSDASTQAPQPKANAQITVAAGDSRVTSNAPAASATAKTSAAANAAANIASNAASTRIAFVPTAQTSVQSEIRAVTDSMIENSQSLLFVGGSASLGVLAALGTGATASAANAAAAAQRPVVVSEVRSSDANAASSVATNPVSTNTFTSTSSNSTDTNAPAVTFKQVDLGVLYVPPVAPSATPAAAPQSTATASVSSTQSDTTATTFVQATVMVSVPALVPVVTTKASAPASTTTASEATPEKTMQAMSAASAPTLGYPVAQAETLLGTEDLVLRLAQSVLLANDSTVNASADPNAPALTITAVSAPLHGQVSLVNGEVLFAPDVDFHGTASFTYTVTDQYGLSTNGTATLLIAAVNDAPVTQGELVASDEDIGLIFTQAQLLANDSDVDVVTDGQVLSISRVGQAEHGTVWLDAQGNLRFVPDTNYHGPAKFTYWVSDGAAADGAGAETPATMNLTILSVNDLPVATGETVNTNEDTTLFFNPTTLLANDTDVDVATDSQVLNITAVSNATHGTVAFVTQLDGSQRIALTPEANYFGVASYQYTVSDGNGGNTVGTLLVNLAQVNDAPIAANDTVSTTAEDTALHISFASLLGNDTDADSLNSKWGGVDDVLTVSVVGNATHGTVAIVNGEVVFTPDTNYHGPASFAYQVSDSSGSVSQALATFIVTAVNDAPVAVGETISENEDITLVISQAALLQNDSDADVATDGQVLSITAVSNAQHGTVTLNANGTISFVPVTNFYGNASFDYTVSDGNGGTTTTTATIALTNVNDAPVATGETINSNEDEVLTIIASTLLQNDSDIDNARADLTISRVQSGTGGTVSLNVSGNVVFTPTLNYNGTATFTYWVKDPSGLESNAVTTTVVLAAVNDAPTVQGEIVTGASEDAVFNISSSTLLANDHDVDDPDSALRLSWVGNATGGAVSLNANGNVVFTPTLNFNGNATFQYKVQDAAGLESALVQAVIPVAVVNDAPVAVDDRFTTYKNSTMTIAFNELTGNDTDADRDALTVSAVRDHANGHASIVNGQVQFVATTGFTGAASFDYLTDDGHGGQVWATAFVEVKPPPNQYATMTLKDFAVADGRFAYDVSASTIFTNGTQTFSLHDDGPVSAISVRFLSASFVSPLPIWESTTDASKLAINWDSANGIFGWNASALTWTIGGTPRPLWDGTLAQMTIQWELTDSQGLKNICTYYFSEYSGVGLLPDNESITSLAAIGFDRSNYAGVRNPYVYGVDKSCFMTYEHSGYYAPPVILDLNGDGVHFTSLQNSHVMMDVNFDGIQDKMAWAGNDDGVLVWDKDQNHQITDASEFGFQTLKAGAQTDLEGLQALDTDGNGLLDAGDAKFAEFAVWQDANGNGVTDAGEFKTLTELGIANINLHSDGQMRAAGTLLANSGSGETDATVMGNATFTRTDGSTGVVADTMLAYEPGHLEPKPVATSVADAQTAEIMRQALLFNQVCNTAVAIDSTPLGFVPIQPDVQLHDLMVAPQDGAHQLMHSA